MCTHFTDSLAVEEGSILTGEVTDGETVVGSAEPDLHVCLADLDLSKRYRVDPSWLSGRGGEERGRGEGGGGGRRVPQLNLLRTLQRN